MDIRDGQTVSYIGPGNGGIDLGDTGKVLSAGATGSHVLWSTGVLTNQIVLVDNLDLAPMGRQASLDGLDDSLDVVDAMSFSAARNAYDLGGEVGVLNQMAEEGLLAAFGSIAEDAYEFIAGRVRQDPSFRAVTSQLDDDEGEALIALASHVLLRDAFGVDSE